MNNPPTKQTEFNNGFVILNLFQNLFFSICYIYEILKQVQDDSCRIGCTLTFTRKVSFSLSFLAQGYGY